MMSRRANDAPTRADGPLAGLRILVADDEIMIALDLETVLSDAGAEVVGPYATVADALGATGQPLSAAVLDIRLGHYTTRDVANRLAASGVPFLFYSGQNLDPVESAAPYLSKPCDPRAIVDALTRLVGRKP